jgi:nucleoside-diphosphate-sugar epimerase
MLIAVTGSKGFIGSHVVERLAQEHEIEEWDLVVGQDCAQFATHADWVIHLAAFCNVHDSVEMPDFYWKHNAETTQTIQNWCYYTHTPLIYASSSCAKEWWRSPYGATKRANELTAQKSQVGLRLTNVFGKGMKDNSLVELIRSNNIKFITDVSRDFVFIDDVVDLIETIMLHDIRLLDPVYEVGSGVSISVETLLSSAQEKQVMHIASEDYEMKDNCATIDKTKELGWAPSYAITDYLKDNK